MKHAIFAFALILVLFSCDKKENPISYTVSGRVVNAAGEGIEGIQIYYTESEYLFSDREGNWFLTDLYGTHTLRAISRDFTFSPLEIRVSEIASDLTFVADTIPPTKENQVYEWIKQQQMPNGLVSSSEDASTVSLYDNALAALVFMLKGDFDLAEKVFDFFNARIASELQNGVGGFSQFRDRNGVPGGHRWMGDNAWLLIALNNYQAMTGNATYEDLANAISDWLVALQDQDGGLWAGYGTDDSLLNYKVTEGNIDAFNAVRGYGPFHQNLLLFLENDRWDALDGNLMAWPENPSYRYALDCQSWSYCIFEDYPISALHRAGRFLTSQTATLTGTLIAGFDIDEDRHMVFLEGTGQMSLAFDLAGLESQAGFYLGEMEKVLVPSPSHADAAGFPYASNPGTAFGSDPLWAGADTKIALSGGAWYLFAKNRFSPFALEREKGVPTVEKFWLD